MKTIIVPTDFSEVSLNAVNYAADMAVEINASIILLHVVEVADAIVTEFPMSGITFQEINREQQLNDLKAAIEQRTHHAISVDTCHLAGNIAYELTEICKRTNPFAVVMAPHAASKLERFFFNSLTYYSATHLPCPVLVVPGKKRYTPIKKIGFATDMKGISHIPVKAIKTITLAFKASLDLIYVGKKEADIEISPTEKLLLRHRLRDFNPSFHFEKNDIVKKGIELFARDKNIDLVLIIPKKHGLFHRSQSKQVIFHLPVPAMALHEN